MKYKDIDKFSRGLANAQVGKQNMTTLGKSPDNFSLRMQRNGAIILGLIHPLELILIPFIQAANLLWDIAEMVSRIRPLWKAAYL